jgi:phosphohistidine swiveling domain-containing protein
MTEIGRRTEFVRTFNALMAEQQSFAGGKGGTLARLYQAGYPVPDGFVILPSGFAGDELTAEAWRQVQAHLARMRRPDPGIAFAVRSSALSEDSAQASFAGEFETVLDVHSDDMIREAIRTVRRSRHSERVRAYSEAQGLDTAHEIAVVVQRLVRADVSGVLFTADPVTGSRTQMTGNYIYGLGDELVSGEAEPYTFTLARPKGEYEGLPKLKRVARKLHKLGSRLEKDLGCPQDIEWAIAEGKLYLLQSRPITTLLEYDPITYDWNSSLTGDYLWARQEPFPDVVTPSTWFLWQQTFLASEVAGISSIGNIGGRIYLNISLPYSLLMKLGRDHEDAIGLFDAIVSPLPESTEIPLIPISMGSLLRDMIPVALRMGLKQRRLKNDYQEIVATVPGLCEKLRTQIQEAQEEGELISLWYEHEVLALFSDLMLLLDAMTEDYRGLYLSLRKALTKLIGKSDASMLMSTIGGGSQELTTIGPVVGLSKVVRGEMSQEAYMAQYGHRHANENELSQPRPYEDPDWLDQEIEEFERNPVDVERLLQRRAAEFDAVWVRFKESHPRKAKALRRRTDGFMEATHKREAVRGAVTQLVGVVRAFFLRAGEMLGLGEEVFFLTHGELIGVLSGDDTAIVHLPARRQTYEKYKALPPYPGWIRGRFDPVQWAADTTRRSDFFDAHAPLTTTSDSDTLKGHPGSAGRAEGAVRLIDSPKEGDQLRPGEILVAVTTNVGWTPLFPRAAAVITDIGAPLAHAAIVARELGIPAVVGCGNATMRLRTGDRVLVDGGRGTVKIMETTDA